ncbi:hypothetical protein AND_008957 [Anopheles darlingi]|uniref:Secreted protein n=1 Tax=Anopheles darlingi TaxID=43151 RepID=W5J4Q2_ANODA|nr:hypothetical protein AND_008957 [Anopheles darlingi]
MKVVICLFAVMAVALAAPQHAGGALTDEAIRQAQSQQLIPSNAQIQGVEKGKKPKRKIVCYTYRYNTKMVPTGIQLAALESIPGQQHVDLFQLLGDQVPREVISNLQSQVDQVGHN